MKQFTNGDIWIPMKKGKNPTNPDESRYSRDTGDPCIFHLRFLKCIYNEEKVNITPCKKQNPYNYCSLKNIILHPLTCTTCSERVSQ